MKKKYIHKDNLELLAIRLRKYTDIRIILLASKSANYNLKSNMNT